MPLTQLALPDVCKRLELLGYGNTPLDGMGTPEWYESEFKPAVRMFQQDYGLVPDGIYGPRSEARLLMVSAHLTTVPPPTKHLLRWRLTQYYIANEAEYTSHAPRVRMRANDGRVLASVHWRAFSAAALNGTIRMNDGRLLNVANNPSYVDCDPAEFEPCYEFARENKWLPNKPGYAGILVDDEKAIKARAFHEIKPGAQGYPILRNIECSPYRTLAADIGAPTISRHDKRFKGKGGVVPPGTKVFILEFVGVKLPDGTVHDGWFVVNDTGGGIFGAHFDVFVGTRALAKNMPPLPSIAHIWFEGCEEKLGDSYTYGL